MYRVFFLSPAKTSGKRASLLLSEKGKSELALRLRGEETVTIGEVFAFLSGLYFRGKVAYSSRFGSPSSLLAKAYVITSNAGLLDIETPLTLTQLQSFSETTIHEDEERYVAPLRASALSLLDRADEACEFVLLGSIATRKYVNILSDVFGSRLHYPKEFEGRGDMSRGALMLRSSRDGEELEYRPVHIEDIRKIERFPKLARLPKRKVA